MTAPPIGRVDIGKIALGDELGRGRHGKVAAVEGLLIRRKCTAAVKIYWPDVLSELDEAVLEKIVAFPGQLALRDSRWIGENTTWPVVLAERGGTLCGFLMRAVPSEYGYPGDSYLDGPHAGIADADRLRMLRSLAAALARLHEFGVVVGDLSPRNVLFSYGSSARCLLIGCDAVQLNGETALSQVQAPGWEVPVGEARTTMASDAYKFGLLAMRLLARDPKSRDGSAIASVSAELGRLASLSQHLDPMRRPGPNAWIDALDQAARAVELYGRCG
jgi:DNA-binding helix-hairpin-helix protein with protein kinase domain